VVVLGLKNRAGESAERMGRPADLVNIAVSGNRPAGVVAGGDKNFPGGSVAEEEDVSDGSLVSDGVTTTRRVEHPLVVRWGKRR
jgi:hypothetical protein